MDSTFFYEGNVYVTPNALPISFAHNRTVGEIRNHLLHMHDSMEIYFFIAGDHKFIVENSIYDLSYGDIIIINPGEVHKILPMSSTTYERFFFSLDCNLFENMLFNPITELLNRPTGMGSRLVVEEKDKEEVISMLYKISQYIQEEQNEPFRIYSLIMRILDIIVYNIQKKSRQQMFPSSAAFRSPELIEKILAYITENAAGIESITEISAAMGMTPQYISSYFSKYTGITLISYLQVKKIALAKDMLIAGKDVTQTCFDCGFNDCSYFIRIFKKHFGMTPAVYKRTKCNKPLTAKL